MSAASPGPTVSAALGVTAALALAPALLATPPASAADHPSGTATSRSDATGKAGKPKRVLPKAVRGFNRGRLTDQVGPWEPIHRLFDAHPMIKDLPRPLTSITDVLADVFAGGKDSTATVGALVDGQPIPTIRGKASGETGRAPRVLTVAHTPDGAVTVTVQKVQGEQGPARTFRFTSPEDLPAGWLDYRVFPEVRARVALAEPRLQVFYPHAITRGSLHMFPHFTSDDLAIMLIRERQMSGDVDGALNMFAEISTPRGLNRVFAKNLSLDEAAQRFYPGSTVRESTLEALEAELLKTNPHSGRPLGILEARNRDFVVETRHGQLILYSNESDGQAETTQEFAGYLARRKVDTVQFLRTDGRATIPVHPRRPLTALAEGEWLMTTHAQAFTQAGAHLQPGETVTIGGALTRDVPQRPTGWQPSDPVPQPKVGEPGARGTRVQWTLHRPAEQPHTFRLRTRWNTSDYVNTWAEDWTEPTAETLTPAQLQAHARAYPTGNTFIRYDHRN